MDYPQFLAKVLAEGASMQQGLSMLRAQGASPLEAITAISAATRVDMAQAQRVFGESTAWQTPLRPGDAAHGHPGAADAAPHGRTGSGAASVLPHLLKQTQDEKPRFDDSSGGPGS